MKVGPTVDALGVDLTIEDGDMVTDVIMVAKVLEHDGTSRPSIGWSDGMSWVERLGMVTAAAQIEAVRPDQAS